MMGATGEPRVATTTAFQGERSRKSLAVTGTYSAYQREWFQGIRARVSAGEPLALVSAVAAQEIFRAMDIPYVVNQWWTGIVAAKQKSAAYMAALRAHGYPTGADAYSSLALGGAMADDDDPPWGGLPPVTFFHAPVDREGDIGRAWALERGALYLPVESTVSNVREYPYWWERMHHDWDRQIAPARVAMLVEEYKGLIRVLEERTGKRFSETRFHEVMHLVNEQEEYFLKTRDLLARTIPAPVTIADTMPATMIPQWQRGTEWGRNAARALYEEIKDRVESGARVVPEEKIRLMFLGTGLWFNMGFYRSFEEQFGAVAVWSIYLAIAADGYIRYFDRGRDPLAALASRYLGMELGSWEWRVREARTHQVDGCISQGPAGYFTVKALEEAGVPVLELPMTSTIDSASWDDVQMKSLVARWLETRVVPVAERRRSGRLSSRPGVM